MKKINVIVKEKTILEIQEDAFKGDIIDLTELLHVDTSFILKAIENNKDIIYQQKLNEFKNTLNIEHAAEIKLLKSKIDELNKINEFNLKLKEDEIKNKYIEKINDLEQEIKQLKKENELEISLLKNNNKTEILNLNHENLIKLNELENKYNNIINNLNLEKKESDLKKELELKEFKLNEKLKYENEIKELNEKYLEEIRKKEEIINNLNLQKSNMNVKQTGENLEAWCDNEVKSYMQNGLLNCTWEKDNLVIKNEFDEKGSKADYIFKIYADNTHNESLMLASICLDMKDENPTSKTKQTNEHYYKKLEENRIKKNCKYSVLVSNLELDKPNILPIYKVLEYENMYVVRPGYLMVFLNMITSLTTRFGNLLLEKNNETLLLKSKLELIDEFDKIKKTYLDDQLDLLEKQLLLILKSSDQIKKAVNDIDNTCNIIKARYINNIFEKINKFEIKLNKSIIKKLD